MRPCFCDNIKECRKCFLYYNDSRYKRLWDSTPAPVPTPAPPPPPSPVEESYVISLPRRQDRREQVAREFGREGIPYTLVDAVDAAGVAVPAFWKSEPGAWGCWQSHLRVLEAVIAKGQQCVAIYEDDAILAPGYAGKLAKLLADVTALDPNWGVVFAGGEHVKPPVETSDPGILVGRDVRRTHAFVLRGRTIQELYDLWKTADIHIDHVWGATHATNTVYCALPWIAFQGKGQSDIFGRHLALREWQPRLPRKHMPPPKRCGSCGQKRGPIK